MFVLLQDPCLSCAAAGLKGHVTGRRSGSASGLKCWLLASGASGNAG